MREGAGFRPLADWDISSWQRAVVFPNFRPLKLIGCVAKLPQMKMLISELVKNTTYWFYGIEVSEFKPTRQF
jgi:hypothetical protein